MATRRDGIWISNGRTASAPYTKEKGVAFVGVRTVVRYAQRHSPSFSSQSRLVRETNFLSSFPIVLLKALYSEFSAKPLERVADELRPIIMRDPPGDTKAIDHVVF